MRELHKEEDVFIVEKTFSLLCRLETFFTKGISFLSASMINIIRTLSLLN